jgi:hypothetical protein
VDWRKADYRGILQERVDNLARIRKRPELVPALKMHYRNNPIDFIQDWGITYDPRLIERGQSPIIPMILFPRQIEFVEWVLERWRTSESGVAPKSRDMGLSVVCQQLAATLCLFNSNMNIGFGSRKEDLVDKVGDPDTLFYKGRMFLSHVPVEFRGGFNVQDKEHSSHLKLYIPETQSIIKGEAGDNIGRGGRTALYFDDESAFQERPLLIDAALSNTTNCRISVSSANGTDNPFYNKVKNWPERRVFWFHWRSDPRKDDEWYRKKCADIDNPIIIAQEIDLNFSAAKTGILIPSEWVQAAVNAHIKLGIKPTGEKRGALDVADEGIDLNAWADRHGIVLKCVEAWSGKGSDTFETTAKAFNLADEKGVSDWEYDADGLGAGIRGDARVLNEQRASKQKVNAFRGSGEVLDKEKEIIKGENGQKGRTNEDYFANRKAQEWWRLRERFKQTYRAVMENQPFNPDELISLDEESIEKKAFAKLCQELSQPTYSINGAGKILIDKAPKGARSPNHADAVMIVYSKRKPTGGFFSR